jgi:hypothetical protein
MSEVDVTDIYTDFYRFFGIPQLFRKDGVKEVSR